jgi:16S rRNA (adenine1518-N6/adenine1519-N6)-dimethyltransferase
MSESNSFREFSPQKNLGQHFLKSQHVVNEILKAADIQATDTILEVGPGPGILTRGLLRSSAHKVIAVELDRQFWESLEKIEGEEEGRFVLVKGDASKVSLESLGGPLKIVANLPYNVGTHLLLNWLQELRHVSKMVLMFQKEVVGRICAEPRTKAYGRLSILTQWKCQVKSIIDVSPESFYPAPKVDSAVVEIIPRDEPLWPVSEDALESLTRILFQSRRKMLRASLKPLKIEDLEGKLRALNISPTARPEELTVEDFCRLASALFRENI